MYRLLSQRAVLSCYSGDNQADQHDSRVFQESPVRIYTISSALVSCNFPSCGGPKYRPTPFSPWDSPSMVIKNVARAVIDYEYAGEESSHEAPPHMRAHPIKAHAPITC